MMMVDGINTDERRPRLFSLPSGSTSWDLSSSWRVFHRIGRMGSKLTFLSSVSGQLVLDSLQRSFRLWLNPFFIGLIFHLWVLGAGWLERARLEKVYWMKNDELILTSPLTIEEEVSERSIVASFSWSCCSILASFFRRDADSSFSLSSCFRSFDRKFLSLRASLSSSIWIELLDYCK